VQWGATEVGIVVWWNFGATGEWVGKGREVASLFEC